MSPFGWICIGICIACYLLDDAAGRRTSSYESQLASYFWIFAIGSCVLFYFGHYILGGCIALIAYLNYREIPKPAAASIVPDVSSSPASPPAQQQH